MLIPKLTVRRCVILGLMLAWLVALADVAARQELMQTAGETASLATTAAVQAAGTIE